jgi:uncharacterized protein YndB with AHSA1/START domain
MNDATTGTPIESVDVDYELAAATEIVWRALTESDLLSTWLMQNDFQPIVGHRFTFRAQPMPHWDGIVHCEVLEVNPPHRLSYSWRGGAGDFALDTIVTWTLEPRADGGTLLHLEHAGFLPKDAMGREGMERGWRGHIADRLREVVAQLG